MHTNLQTRLLRRVRILTALFVVGLVISGITAIPLMTELSALARLTEAGCATPCSDAMSAQGQWFHTVFHALAEMRQKHPFLFYGTDWLAFGHMVIAIAFIGAWRDPVRNRWLFDFGLIACALVIPWALIFGAVRGIPLWWRLIDCSFGVIGATPLWLCRRWVKQLRPPGQEYHFPMKEVE